ncbi:MAG: hypothetical protein AAGB10_00835 [Pseudomonadota bacterium]
MSAALNLQEFSPHPLAEGPAPSETMAAELEKAYARGYDAGVKAGAEASAQVHAEAQDRLRSEVVEILRDQHQSRFAAQTEVLQDVIPLIETVVRQIAPQLIPDGLPEHARSVLADAIGQRPDLMPILRCAPDAVESLRGALVEWNGRFEIQPDRRLTPNEVQVAWNDGFDHIDLSASVQTMLEQIGNTVALMAKSNATDPSKGAQDVG